MKFHRYNVLDSTNDRLAQMAEAGAPEGTVVLADRQTSGKGRQEKDWWSPEGNLHLSILLRPKVSPRELMRLPVIASLAFLSALGEPGASLQIKWPNDILFKGRKMAGILVESRSEGDKTQWAMVGFGVNMVRSSDYIPEDLKNRLAFVHELDDSLEPHEMALRIVSGMKMWSKAMTGEGWEKAREEWTQNALLNVPYIFRDGGKITRGKPVRLDISGGLVMETGDGEVTVYSGEMEEIVQK